MPFLHCFLSAGGGNQAKTAESECSFSGGVRLCKARKTSRSIFCRASSPRDPSFSSLSSAVGQVEALTPTMLENMGVPFEILPDYAEGPTCSKRTPETPLPNRSTPHEHTPKAGAFEVITKAYAGAPAFSAKRTLLARARGNLRATWKRSRNLRRAYRVMGGGSYGASRFFFGS